MMRPDLDAKEKLILMDLIMREPPPEEKVNEETGQTFKMIGMAVATDEQIAERTKISPKVVQVRLKSLHKRGFLRKKPSKGRVPNRYNVTFPHKAKTKVTEAEAKASNTPPPTPQSTAPWLCGECGAMNSSTLSKCRECRKPRP
jgi:hypothetical protein